MLITIISIIAVAVIFVGVVFFTRKRIKDESTSVLSDFSILSTPEVTVAENKVDDLETKVVPEVVETLTSTHVIKPVRNQHKRKQANVKPNTKDKPVKNNKAKSSKKVNASAKIKSKSKTKVKTKTEV